VKNVRSRTRFDRKSSYGTNNYVGLKEAAGKVDPGGKASRGP
jgi:hypothetical protein